MNEFFIYNFPHSVDSCTQFSSNLFSSKVFHPIMTKKKNLNDKKKNLRSHIFIKKRNKISKKISFFHHIQYFMCMFIYCWNQFNIHLDKPKIKREYPKTKVEPGSRELNSSVDPVCCYCQFMTLNLTNARQLYKLVSFSGHALG